MGGISKSGERKGWLDAMRGVTIMMVVFGHVLFFGFDIQRNDSFLGWSMGMFRMPLFFFISGYVAYRKYRDWNFGYAGSVILRKFRAQLLATVFFLVLYELTFGGGLEGILDPSMGKYWFTVVLFRIYLLYAIPNLLLRMIKYSCIEEWVETGIALLMIVTGGICSVMFHEESSSGGWLAIVDYRTLAYLPYFGLGLMMREFEKRITGYISRKVVIYSVQFYVLACMLLWVSIDWGVIAIESTLYKIIVRGMGCMGIWGMFMGFYTLRHRIDSGKGIGNILRYIGRRTLDIYFIHYFFLPDMLGAREFMFSAGGINFPGLGIVIQGVVGGVLTLIVTGCSLGVSYLLRLSPFLRVWMFGEKPAIISHK